MKQFNPAKWSVPKPKERKQFDPAAMPLTETDPAELPLGPLRTWSFSSLMNYETCPYRAYLSGVKRLPQPESEALLRGSQIHEQIENYIQGQSDDLSMVKHQHGIIDTVREDYANGKCQVEENWGYTRDWVTTGWTAPDTWARIKLDAFVQEDDNIGVVYDWKSGRKFGNEAKHATQLMVYAIGSFMRYPQLEYIIASMVYVDKNEELTVRYTRDSAAQFKKTIDKRALAMTTATDFPPRPNKFNCKWCPYKEPIEEGQPPPCPWGVID